MNLIGLPEDEAKEFLKQGTLAVVKLQQLIDRANRFFDRAEAAATRAVARWQVPGNKT